MTSVRTSRSRNLLPVLALVCLLAGCSDDDSPTTPVDDTPANTPEIPTVDNPADELPATSDLLAVEDAPLGNFSPKVVAASPIVDTLNAQAMALEFRLVSGYCRLVRDGVACPPTNLQWASLGFGNWSDCVPDTVSPVIEYLGEREGSYYYGLPHDAFWMVHDLTARLAGGNLVCFGTEAENVYVHDLRQAAYPGEYIALGCYDWGRTNNDYAWRSGEAMTYTNWGGGEPNNDDGEFFGVMYTNSAGWNDYNGTWEIPGIMETVAPLILGDETEIPVLLLGASPLRLGELGELEATPVLVRSVYWAKVFQRTIGAGATYTQAHSYTHGTSETNGMSFGWSIGISTSLGWGPVSAKISTEFHQDFEREISVSEETTVTRTYECTAPADKTVVFALWQLRERYTICDADGEPWADSRFALDGDLPYLEQGLDQEYLQTIYFDQ